MSCFDWFLTQKIRKTRNFQEVVLSTRYEKLFIQHLLYKFYFFVYLIKNIKLSLQNFNNDKTTY